MLELKGMSFNTNLPTSDIEFCTEKGRDVFRFLDFLRRIEDCKRSRTDVNASRIVYVDSDPSSRDLMSNQIERLGLTQRFVQFEDGQQALKYFIEQLSAEQFKYKSGKTQIACLLILEINMQSTIGNEILS